MTRLGRDFFERNTAVVAMELIGKTLVFQNGMRLSGVIVETEAYFGADDPASHAYRGPTPRNRVMFGPAGFSYVYFTYGNHHCFNVVTEQDKTAGAVLIRALEPREGMEHMFKRRGVSDSVSLTSGPGKLTQAFGITREHSGLDLTGEELFVCEEERARQIDIQVTARIGISAARELPLRFYSSGSPYVSKR